MPKMRKWVLYSSRALGYGLRIPGLRHLILSGLRALRWWLQKRVTAKMLQTELERRKVDIQA